MTFDGGRARRGLDRSGGVSVDFDRFEDGRCELPVGYLGCVLIRILLGESRVHRHVGFRYRSSEAGITSRSQGPSSSLTARFSAMEKKNLKVAKKYWGRPHRCQHIEWRTGRGEETAVERERE